MTKHAEKHILENVAMAATSLPGARYPHAENSPNSRMDVYT
jgi:hypothetical protein